MAGSSQDKPAHGDNGLEAAAGALDAARVGQYRSRGGHEGPEVLE
jgi:hypothetical protein